MIAEMMAAKIAAEISALNAVRPLKAARGDRYPLAVYETAEMRNKRSLNRCPSTRWDGVVRFYFAAIELEDLSPIVEQAKSVLIDYVEDGPEYRIRQCDVVGEEDVDDDVDEAGQAFYVKSIDVSVRANKVPAATP